MIILYLIGIIDCYKDKLVLSLLELLHDAIELFAFELGVFSLVEEHIFDEGLSLAVIDVVVAVHKMDYLVHL